MTPILRNERRYARQWIHTYCTQTQIVLLNGIGLRNIIRPLALMEKRVSPCHEHEGQLREQEGNPTKRRGQRIMMKIRRRRRNHKRVKSEE